MAAAGTCMICLSIAILIIPFVAVDGFTVDLIHRDSPDSPLYNPYETPTQRLNKAFHRKRLNLLQTLTTTTSSSTDAAQSPIRTDSGEYMIKLSIGTPPRDIYAIFDTGSLLTWAQCLPCDQCFEQVSPFFDPAESSTYQDLPCDSQQCGHLPYNTFCSAEYPNVCNYTYNYADGSVTAGFLATEKFTFTSIASSSDELEISNLLFGCGHNNSGLFNKDEMGLAGLARGPASLISQMASSVGGRKFSQCLVPFGTDPNITSKLSFGVGSQITGAGVVSIPLAADKQNSIHYWVTLHGISIGEKFLPYSSSVNVSEGEGNFVIDSGTPITYLPNDLYKRLVVEVENAIPMAPINDDPQLGGQLCYSSLPSRPVLTAHFDGGAHLQWLPLNTFIQAKETAFCFAMHSSIPAFYPAIFGNYAQMNFLIGFDLETGIISFKPTDCTKS